MKEFAANLIDALGGTTAVAIRIDAPVTTVQSWKTNGIPRSRVSHLKLVAQADGKVIDWATGRLVSSDGDSADHGPVTNPAAAIPSPDSLDDRIGTEAKQVAA